MLFENINILNEKFEIEENIYVGIVKDKITYIGKERPKESFESTYSGKGKLLMPGFYNSHGHSPMTLLRGYGENLPLQRWLEEKIFPFEAKLNSDSIYWGTMLAMAESLKYGIVSTTDMYYFMDDMIGAVSDVKTKINASRGIVNFSDDRLRTLKAYDEMEKAVKQYHNSSSEKVKIDGSLHGEYTSNEHTARDLAQFVKEANIRMHVHVSETLYEHEECKKRHKGKTPVEYLNFCGIFDVPTTAAHCVWVEGEDYDILKAKNVTVATNPKSNMKLASGICNTAKMFDMGINVALGTDSVASNNNLNLLEELRIMSLVEKIKHNDPTVISPVQALKAATINGAIGQGRLDCGCIKEGNKADLIVLNIDTPNMVPIHNLINNIVFAATSNEILLTMVDGEVLYKEGNFTTIDIEKTMHKASEATKKILESI